MRGFKLKALAAALVTTLLIGCSVVMADTEKTLHPGEVFYPGDYMVVVNDAYARIDDKFGETRWLEAGRFIVVGEFEWNPRWRQWCVRMKYDHHPMLGSATFWLYLGFEYSTGVDTPIGIVCTGGSGAETDPYTLELIFEDVVPMYRLYNPNSGEHFYTSDFAERSNLISLGWNDENIGWYAPAHSDTPVYRLYNPNAGEHHYTTDINERDHLISLGWNDEDIGWYSDDFERVPLYRQYNPNEFANNHNYTTSLDENDWLVSLGWQAEDIGWYGVG